MNLIYLDNHATTRVDPAVVETMRPWLDELYANPGSTTHEAGRLAKEQVDAALDSIATFFDASRDEVVITSGATESNNLAAFGVCLHPRQKRRKIVSVVTEHQAMLGPLSKLERMGFEVVRVPVHSHPTTSWSEETQVGNDSDAGRVDLDRLCASIDDSTAMVSVMLANNEIGVLQPIRDIHQVCQRYGVPLHTDATQGVGRTAVDPNHLPADLVSFSAHKIYGPKGVGGLIVRNTGTSIQLAPQIVGGGQQNNFRSGTLNSMGIVGLAKALQIAWERRTADAEACWRLRDRLWRGLRAKIPGLMVNGPAWRDGWEADSQGWPVDRNRLINNLNVCFPKVDGQSLMLETPELAVSSGSACTSAHPEPSHVLRAIGRSEDESRASLRFGIGRFNTEQEIDRAIELLAAAHRKLASFVA